MFHLRVHDGHRPVIIKMDRKEQCRVAEYVNVFGPPFDSLEVVCLIVDVPDFLHKVRIEESVSSATSHGPFLQQEHVDVDDLKWASRASAYRAIRRAAVRVPVTGDVMQNARDSMRTKKCTSSWSQPCSGSRA